MSTKKPRVRVRPKPEPPKFDMRQVRAGEALPFPVFYRDSVNRSDEHARRRCEETLATCTGQTKQWFSLNWRSFEKREKQTAPHAGWIVFCVEAPVVNALGLESL